MGLASRSTQRLRSGLGLPARPVSPPVGQDGVVARTARAALPLPMKVLLGAGVLAVLGGLGGCTTGDGEGARYIGRESSRSRRARSASAQVAAPRTLPAVLCHNRCDSCLRSASVLACSRASGGQGRFRPGPLRASGRNTTTRSATGQPGSRAIGADQVRDCDDLVLGAGWVIPAVPEGSCAADTTRWGRGADYDS